MAARWVKPIKTGKPRYRDGFHDLTVVSINHGDRMKLFLFDADGQLNPDALADLAYLLRDKDTEEGHEVHPRLALLMYKLADFFGINHINVISGYRSSDDPDEESQHHRGRAMDIALPGVRIAALARKARTLGHVGVGLYPVSGFVHIDVRDGPSHFWIDPSGPGKTSCMRSLKLEVGPRSDRKWKPENDEPSPKKDRNGQLLGATEEAASVVGGAVQP